MICTVIYSADHIKGNYLKTFNTVLEANEFIEELSRESTAWTAQLLVDYSNVAFYQEKFEELYADLKASKQPLRNTIKEP